ncbi:MAG: hypothetical protein EB023_09470 [Flavobacteriia bacterium]|nr:hypothetical protein [Flavobacteriia bacterium]
MKIFLIFILSLVFSTFHAQHSFSSHQTHAFDLTQNKIISSQNQTQTFNISFSDSLLIHNKFNDEHHIVDSQIYKITNISEQEEMILFSALSGVSGNTYNYVISYKENETMLMQLFQEENSMLIFDGEHSRLKPFNQP